MSKIECPFAPGIKAPCDSIQQDLTKALECIIALQAAHDTLAAFVEKVASEKLYYKSNTPGAENVFSEASLLRDEACAILYRKVGE